MEERQMEWGESRVTLENMMFCDMELFAFTH